MWKIDSGQFETSSNWLCLLSFAYLGGNFAYIKKCFLLACIILYTYFYACGIISKIPFGILESEWRRRSNFKILLKLNHSCKCKVWVFLWNVTQVMREIGQFIPILWFGSLPCRLKYYLFFICYPSVIMFWGIGLK